MKRKFLFIIPILIVSFLVYWFWPQPTIPSIIDEGHHTTLVKKLANTLSGLTLKIKSKSNTYFTTKQMNPCQPKLSL